MLFLNLPVRDVRTAAAFWAELGLPANPQFCDEHTSNVVIDDNIVVMLLERSRFGAHLVAVRENEAAARALGVDVLRVKLAAITLSAGVTAAAGCFYTQYFLYLDANIAYGAWISVEALLAPIIGGLGTVFGPLVGAVALHGLSEITKGYTGGLPGLDLVIFGVLLIVMVAFAPDGAMGLLRRLTGRFRRPAPVPRPAPEALP